MAVKPIDICVLAREKTFDEVRTARGAGCELHEGDPPGS